MAVLLGVLFFTNTSFTGKSGGGDLQWTNYTEGVQQASATNRKILVDVFTNWCGWCKKMESDTYSNWDIQHYLSENFVLVKLNAESSVKETVGAEVMTQAEIAKAYKVNGYPTTIFLDAVGQPITFVSGYMKPDEFMPILRYVAEEYYKRMSYDNFVKMQNSGPH